MFIGTHQNNIIQDVVTIQNHPELCQRNCLLTENMWHSTGHPASSEEVLFRNSQLSIGLKLVSSPLPSTGRGPIEDFESLLLNHNYKLDLWVYDLLAATFIGYTPLNLWQTPVNLQDCKHIFLAFFLILPDVILVVFMNKKQENVIRRHFWRCQ